VFVVDGSEVPARHRVVPFVPQEGATLVERLVNVFRPPGPTLLVATDVPQVQSDHLRLAAASLAGDGPRAVLGRTEDGGFWCLGLSAATTPDFLHQVDMASPRCADDIVRRLRAAGVATLVLPFVLRDIDDAQDAAAVAAGHPRLEFSREFRRIASSLVP
jgi:glycosyltransferase A (GT-A) superfamily protein (DUF2064 family)